jgi:hypothetical protein
LPPEFCFPRNQIRSEDARGAGRQLPEDSELESGFRLNDEVREVVGHELVEAWRFASRARAKHPAAVPADRNNPVMLAA